MATSIKLQTTLSGVKDKSPTLKNINPNSSDLAISYAVFALYDLSKNDVANITRRQEDDIDLSVLNS